MSIGDVVKCILLRPQLTFPAPGSSAGQHQPGTGNGQSDFLRLYFSAVGFELCAQHVGEHGRSQSRGVRVYKEEQWVIRKDVGTKFDKVVDGIFDFPDFTFRASAVGWRIHNDGVVMVAPADLALYEFDTIIHQPADRRVLKSGRYCVFFCPCDHALGGVHMGYAGACSGCSKCGTAGVSEQIQYFNRSSGISYFIREPVPVGGLLREQTGMLEAERFQVESQIAVMKLPLLAQIE